MIMTEEEEPQTVEKDNDGILWVYTQRRRLERYRTVRRTRRTIGFFLH